MTLKSRAALCTLAALALASASLPAVASPTDAPTEVPAQDVVTIVAVPGATSPQSALKLLDSRMAEQSRIGRVSAAQTVSTREAAATSLRAAAEAGTLQQEPEPTTVEEARALARKSTQTYTEDSAAASASTTAKAAPKKDYMTFKECNSHGETSTPDGWFKNHWSWCQGTTYIMSRITSKGHVDGNIVFRSTVIGRGYAGTRKTTFTTYIDETYIEGSWPRGGSNLNVSFDCRGVPDAGDHCQVSGSKTFFIDKDFKKGDVDTTMKSPASGARGDDKISAGVFTPKYIADNASPVGTEHGYTSGFRCDSASYLGSKGACIFDRVTGTFQLSRKDSDVNESAKHIYSAQHASDSAKRSPSVLTRATSKDLQTRNTNVAHAACKKISKDRPKGKDCDEYPFKSTYQGAANAGKHYSVKYIDSDDNQETGRRLGSWYKLDRILDGDAFNVWIR